MQSLKIAALCIAAAILYGIAHDLITTRVCVEYFTIGHPPIFQTNSPTVLAIGWGVLATWWVGAILAVPAVLVSRVGVARWELADIHRGRLDSADWLSAGGDGGCFARGGSCRLLCGPGRSGMARRTTGDPGATRSSRSILGRLLGSQRGILRGLRGRLGRLYWHPGLAKPLGAEQSCLDAKPREAGLRHCFFETLEPGFPGL